MSVPTYGPLMKLEIQEPLCAMSAPHVWDVDKLPFYIVSYSGLAQPHTMTSVLPGPALTSPFIFLFSHLGSSPCNFADIIAGGGGGG